MVVEVTDQNIIGLYGIDTRALVKILRSNGAMNGVITSLDKTDESCLKIICDTPKMEGLNLSNVVSTKQQYLWNSHTQTIFDLRKRYDETAKKLKIVAIDFGIKYNILRQLEFHECDIMVFPANTSADEIMDYNPSGVFLSNGPGDPSSMPVVIEEVKRITTDGKPVFGICLGHQVLALSEGISTYKMHNGHRGINHPVKNLVTEKAEVTSQNHGFGISKEDIQNNPNIEVTHINLNDDTIEGIKLLNKNCFSVQYHPESSPGPHDSRYLFDQFVENIKNNNE